MQPQTTGPLTAGARTILSMLCTVAREVRASDRDPLGAKWCRKQFVGRIRKRLGATPGENVVSISGTDAHGQREAAAFFAVQCKACALCELGRE